MTRIVTSSRFHLIIACVYLVFFQIFLHSPKYLWLCLGNASLFLIIVAFAFFTEQNRTRRLGFSDLLRKGIQVSFRAALAAFAGAILLSALNFYITPLHTPGSFFAGMVSGASAAAGWKSLASALFTNALLVNFVCGILAAFFAAGLINERNYNNSSGPLPSVDMYEPKKKKPVQYAGKLKVKKSSYDDREEKEEEHNWLSKKLVLQAE